jgi:hypothetical protein
VRYTESAVPVVPNHKVIDHAEMTAVAAAHICYELLALMVLGNRSGQPR